MDFITDFYKGLETLDLIIFWGIIIVIILLLIFSVIMINKNSKLKKLVNKNNDKEKTNNKDEELPIKKENDQKQSQTIKEQQNIDSEKEEEKAIILPEIPQIQKSEDNNQENISETIQTEKKFIAEEHVMEYNKDLFSIPNVQKTSEQYETIKEQPEKMTNNIINTKPIEMPTGPYQRNVLREMSLSQTSPIGLTTPKKKEDKKFELAKDLEDSLNIEQKELQENKNKLTTEETISLIRRIPKENQKYNNKLNNNQNNETPRNDTNKYNDINKEVYNKEQHNKELYRQEKNNKEINQNSERKEETQQNKSNQNYTKENETIKKELSSIENTSSRRTEIKNDESKNNTSIIERREDNYKQQERPNYEIPKINRETKEESTSLHKTNINSYETKTKLSEYQEKTEQPLRKEFTTTQKNISQPNIDPQVKELLNSVSSVEHSEKKNITSEKYLEEVSRKLAEADIPDEIERTDYELEQEENAIISYKELMEKKDSIQTIDEEEAVISIEELMNRNNKKQEQKESDNKLYNLTDEEENDDFIKELKQFRNDL